MSCPPHLVELAGGFRVWRCLRLRGAGFPASMPGELATPGAAHAIDRAFELEGEAAAARVAAIEACAAALEEADGAVRAELVRTLRRLRRGQALEATQPAAAGLPPEVERAQAIERERAAAFDEAARGYDTERAHAAVALRNVARDPLFREAITWQNRDLLGRALDPLLRTEAGATDKETRQRELLVARYLQRYALKNDTIGFFGPVGWGSFAEIDEAVRAEPGPSLLAGRAVYFEHWAVDALAARLGAEAELRPSLAPRRMPKLRVEGRALTHPIDQTTIIDTQSATLLAACDGVTPARELARRLATDPSLEFEGEGEVLYLLEDLAERGFVTWTLEVPAGDGRPEEHIRRALHSATDGPAKGAALAALDELCAGRAKVSAAAGNTAALAGALDELSATFTRLTGQPHARRGGQTYAGRGLCYEDCRRAVDLQVGRPLLERLAGPLSLLLASARWYTWSIATKYRAVFEGAYQALRLESGSPRVDLQRFRKAVDPHFAGRQSEPTPIVAEIARELRRRWTEIFAADPSANAVSLATSALAPRVWATFDAPHPGWPLARYHSPDLLLGAASPEALRAGDYSVVLGELHVSANTLLTRMALEQHPEPGLLASFRDVDLPTPGVATVEPKSHATRADHFSTAAHDVHVELGETRSFRPRDRVVAIADLVVEQGEGGDLVVRTRDGARSFDVVAFFEQDLMFACLGHFGLLAPAPHTPRVVVDSVVVARETWRFDASDLAPLNATTPFARFAAVRRWARRHGLPRHCFFKLPTEPKPCYVDFESAVYVEMFARMAAGASGLACSEMLPRADEAWLLDADGRRYTSELRIAAVDPVPWPQGRQAGSEPLQAGLAPVRKVRPQDVVNVAVRFAHLLELGKDLCLEALELLWREVIEDRAKAE